MRQGTTAGCEEARQRIGDRYREPTIGLWLLRKLAQQGCWVLTGLIKPAAQTMRKLGYIAQTKVQALTSNRVQGLGCITNGDNTLCGQLTSSMQTQGKYKTLARQGQSPQAEIGR